MSNSKDANALVRRKRVTVYVTSDAHEFSSMDDAVNYQEKINKRREENELVFKVIHILSEPTGFRLSSEICDIFSPSHQGLTDIMIKSFVRSMRRLMRIAPRRTEEILKLLKESVEKE